DFFRLIEHAAIALFGFPQLSRTVGDAILELEFGSFALRDVTGNPKYPRFIQSCYGRIEPESLAVDWQCVINIRRLLRGERATNLGNKNIGDVRWKKLVDLQQQAATRKDPGDDD